MLLSDTIASFIDQMLNDCGGTLEIKRNDLAKKLGCVPSQINYVVASRFTPERGYLIESRRGGGGYIRIRRVVMNHTSALMHIINSIGDAVDPMTTRIILENCIESGIIPSEVAKLIATAGSASVLQAVPVEYRNTLRAALLKQLLLTQIK